MNFLFTFAVVVAGIVVLVSVVSLGVRLVGEDSAEKEAAFYISCQKTHPYHECYVLRKKGNYPK